MNKLVKYIVLLAGLAGIAGFFLPILSVTDGGITAEISTMQVVSGNAADYLKGEDIDKSSPKARATAVELDANLKKARMIFVAMYVPSVLLVLLGILAIAIRRFGRGIAAVALLSSIAAIAIYALLQGVVGGVASDGGSAAVGLGGHLIIVSGALGLLCALVGLIKPEAGFKPSARHKATIARRPV